MRTYRKFKTIENCKCEDYLTNTHCYELKGLCQLEHARCGYANYFQLSKFYCF